MKLDTKLDPWSDKISEGSESLENICTRASATALEVVLFRGTASGYQVARSMYVKIWVFLLCVIGSGPTMSVATL